MMAYLTEVGIRIKFAATIGAYAYVKQFATGCTILGFGFVDSTTFRTGHATSHIHLSLHLRLLLVNISL